MEICLRTKTQVKKKKIDSVHVKYLALKPTVFSKRTLALLESFPRHF